MESSRPTAGGCRRQGRDVTARRQPPPTKVNHSRYYLAVAVTVCACYCNALQCGFVFDDLSAVRDNRDLRPSTPLFNLFFNDFWGTSLHKEHSHKSYRPLCVLTFRLNYIFHELDPMGYHLVNVLLHALVCLLYLRLCLLFLPTTPSMVAALLFAVHPIHTEAVTGVVGRAETLSSVFFLLAFFSYCQSSSRWPSDVRSILFCVLLVGTATLCKEQGITVVGVCCVYEVFVLLKFKPSCLLYVRDWSVYLKSLPHSSPVRDAALRLLIVICGAACVLLVRLRLMGSQLPVFNQFDNPAAVARGPTRQLTYNYLLPVNAWLLLFPCDLCCDWTMGTIPLVESLADPRNAATLAFFTTFGALTWSGLSNENSHGHIVLMSLALMVFPFLPASNLFFPVGLVVAERVLYLPSMGFCLLVAYGWFILWARRRQRLLLSAGLVLLLCLNAMKTLLRNFDWRSDYTLFTAGLRVNQRNAKLYNNMGHVLEEEGKFQEALEYFLIACRIQPDDVGAHLNVGRTYSNLGRLTEAEKAFWKAKDLLPRPRPGEVYRARIAPSHLNVFLNLGSLLSRNGSRLEEADALYRQAISMKVDYIPAYMSRADVLIKLNRSLEAQGVYEKALKYDNMNADIYYNLGVIYLEQGRTDQALLYFDKALNVDPEHEQSLVNFAILIQETGNSQLRRVAYDRLGILMKSGRANERIHFNMGMLAMEDKDLERAEDCFRRAVQLRDDFRSALFNLALLLSSTRRPLEAVPFLKRLLKYHPDHVKGLILLGNTYFTYVKDYTAAKQCYQRILQLDPDNYQAFHNLCAVYMQQGHLQQAEQCLVQAASLAPGEQNIRVHLHTMRKYQRNVPVEGVSPEGAKCYSTRDGICSTSRQMSQPGASDSRKENSDNLHYSFSSRDHVTDKSSNNLINW